MKTLRTAPLEVQHLPDVLRIDKESQSAPWSEASFKAEIERPQGQFLVALGDGKVIGFAGAWLVIDEAHITNIAVDPSLRRQGIARRLMTDLLSRMVDAGALCSTLEVRASNAPAINLYESLGFTTSGRRKNYYPDNKEDAIVMWLHDLSAFRS